MRRAFDSALTNDSTTLGRNLVSTVTVYYTVVW